MPKKRHKPEEIVAKLRQVDVLTSQGQSVAEAIRAISVSELTTSSSLRANTADMAIARSRPCCATPAGW
jgi:hypothetical protein